MSRRGANVHVVDDEVVLRIRDNDEVQPEDSASQVENAKSTASGSSTSSTALRLKAKAAALQAEAEAMKHRHLLEAEETQLRERMERHRRQMEEHDINTRIAMITAESRVFDEAASLVSKAVHDNVNPDQQQQSNLNPLAPTWNLSEACTVAAPVDVDENIKHYELLAAVNLPRTELMYFDGNPLDYWAFIRSFQNTVEKACSDDVSRLTRLLQYCKGKAKHVIQCCTVMDPKEGYKRAQTLLKERFGNSYIIAEAWVNRVAEGKPIGPHDKELLRDFADDLINCETTLTSMGYLNEVNSQRVLVKVVGRLPTYLQNRWIRIVRDLRANSGRDANIHDLVAFVTAAAEEANDPVYSRLAANKQKHHGGSQFQSQKSGRTPTFSGLTSREDPQRREGEYSCTMCSGSHSIFRCEQFRSLQPEDRRKFAKEKGLCFNCLRAGHRSLNCKSERTCTVQGCQQKHSKFLHLVNKPNAGNGVVATTPNVANTNNSGTFSGAGTSSTMVALPLVPVKIWRNDRSHCLSTFALLDSGSTTTFCTERLARLLKIKCKPETLTLNTLGQTAKQLETSSVSLDVTDLEEQTEIHLEVVYTTAELPISSRNGVKKTDLEEWSHFQDIEICDASFDQVDLLIGQDNPEALVPQEVRSSSKDHRAPFAVRTALGWTVQGPVRKSTVGSKAIVGFINSDVKLQQSLERFWKLDSDENMADDSKMSVSDRKVVSLWEDSVKVDDGHYELPIPFSRDKPALANNRIVAERRLSLLQRKLNNDRLMYDCYKQGMADMLSKGYAEKVAEAVGTQQTVSVETESEIVWYLPHHGVTSSHKPDKVRIVFDCAAKFQGVSLNDEVLQGPDLTNKLLGVLMRFREEPIALMADIESMFYQVKVTPQDRNVLKFLWWKNGDLNSEVEEYRMKVHPFGGVWSPSCANFALQRTAADYRDQFDERVTRCICRNFYVDDCLKSVGDENEAVWLVGQLTELLALGGFRLTKWISNCREVLETIPEEEKASQVKNLDMSCEKLPTERALGAVWDIESDTFGFRTIVKRKPLTRRGILSMLSSIYDPLGFLSPWVISAKRIIQELCRQHIGWDEQLPEKEAREWTQWLEELPKIESLRLTRCFKSPDMTEVEYELHHFADASMTAYGTVTYLRAASMNGNVRCSLLLAKSRLAPMKTQTLPRLELMAATLAAKVDLMVRRELDLPITRSIFWTDSTLVLQYIISEQKRFNIFVANRIAVIRDVTSPLQWKHVSSEENAADDLTRGLSADDLTLKQRWWNGPAFLRQPEQDWPAQVTINELSDNDPELKRVKPTENLSMAIVETKDQRAQVEDVLEKMLTLRSSWFELRRDVAWMMRFISYMWSKTKNDVSLSKGPLSASEMNRAENAILRLIQTRHFSTEMKALKTASEQSIQKNSTLRKLDPILMPNGLICVGGRLRHTPVLPEEVKHPIILPRKHYVVKLIVRHTHEKNGHVGREHILSLLQEKYWVIGGRSLVRQVLNECVTCKRISGCRSKQKMADLPEERVTPGCAPFTYVGVDLFGPFIVKHGRSQVKRYGCIFTCMTIRAVHIEVVNSLDTDSFVNALQRFICRRGHPEIIFSDNGTNLVGAEKELRNAIKGLNSSRVDQFLKQKSIQWKFNPPTASHMGGIWERQIRSVRKILSGLMKQQTIDDEGLMTLLCQVEFIINSRPITTVSDDPKDLEPLTPNHLLLLQFRSSTSPGQFVNEDQYSRRRWRQVQYLADVFWRRWLREYIPMLQLRSKWNKVSRNMAPGDVVILTDDNLPRNSWPLGRVVETYPSADGLVRTVKVMTKNATLIRPVHKLCLLEPVGDET